MLDLAERLKKARQKLQNVQTRVTLENGSEICEKRLDSGEFGIVNDEGITTDNTVSTDSDVPTVSNRRRKLVERAQRFGFVIDLTPDLQVANVADHVFLGSQDVAQDFTLLKQNKITHIINVSTGVKNFFPTNFKYLSLSVLDVPSDNIREHFVIAINFIMEAISTNGNVFIHCNAGISRSTTLALAYIMFRERKSLDDALTQVKRVRSIAKPNEGFLRQLAEFEKELQTNADGELKYK